MCTASYLIDLPFPPRILFSLHGCIDTHSLGLGGQFDFILFYFFFWGGDRLGVNQLPAPIKFWVTPFENEGR